MYSPSVSTLVSHIKMPNNNRNKKNKNSNNNNNKRKKKNNQNNSISRKRVPMATAVSVSSSRPSIIQTKRGTRVSSHQIIVEDMAVDASFTIQGLKFNPGLKDFPWLSNFGSNYEKYHVHKLHVHFIPSQATTITPGSIYLAADYDPEDSPNPTLQGISTYESMNSGKVYEEIILRVDTSRIHTTTPWLKVRDRTVPFDLSNYDACTILYGSKDGDGSNAGQLWLYYDIEFISSQVEAINNITRMALDFQNSSDIALTIGSFKYVTLDSFSGILPVTTYDFIVGGQSQRAYILPVGDYLVRWTASCYSIVPSSIRFELQIRGFIKNGAAYEVTTFANDLISYADFNPEGSHDIRTCCVTIERIISIRNPDSLNDESGFVLRALTTCLIGGAVDIYTGHTGMIIQQL